MTATAHARPNALGWRAHRIEKIFDRLRYRPWFAGKDFLGSCAPRESLAWRPSPGLYRLVALDDRGRSSSSTVNLRSTQGE